MPIFGAKSRAARGCASKLACGRRIDPHGARPFYDALRQIYKCPTGGQRRPPLQDVLRGRRWRVQFCDCVLPGRCGHRPLQTDCVVAIRCAYLPVHPARAGLAPALRRNVAASQKPRPFPSSVGFADSYPYPLCPFGAFPPDRGNRPPKGKPDSRVIPHVREKREKI